SNVVTIQNTPPGGSGVALEPDPATVVDTFTATPLGWVDPDEDTEFWRYDWFINGTSVGTGGARILSQNAA
ncbi:MAG: hypothetical protein ACO3BO_07445, partial [Anaerohalosphaeraceae bacterium]